MFGKPGILYIVTFLVYLYVSLVHPIMLIQSEKQYLRWLSACRYWYIYSLSSVRRTSLTQVLLACCLYMCICIPQWIHRCRMDITFQQLSQHTHTQCLSHERNDRARIWHSECSPYIYIYTNIILVLKARANYTVLYLKHHHNKSLFRRSSRISQLHI